MATGTIKNRMSAMRWWAEKIGKDSVVERTNDTYGIRDRVFVTNVSKTKTLDADTLAKITAPCVAISLRLRAAFGLRREENIKIIPAWADCGDVLRLKEMWTNSGRYRELSIASAERRVVLDATKALANGGSLIPAYMTYRGHSLCTCAQCSTSASVAGSALDALLKRAAKSKPRSSTTT